MRKCLAFVSFLLCLSCSPRLLVSKADPYHESQADSINAEVVSLKADKESSADGQYNFILKAGKRELTGVLVARQEEEGAMRVVGATYFGMRLFDITYTDSGYEVNSCTEFLNKKIITSFIARELRKRL